MSKLLEKLNTRYGHIKSDEWLSLCEEFWTFESQLRAADELAKTAKELRIVLGKFKGPMPKEFAGFDEALTAYEKVRNGK